jgi:Kyakuja-Dileera-Zisupton transposase
MELWESLEITGAISKWHLTAHIAECFTKYTLNFIKGAAQVDGEILETLWSPLDEVAGLTQAMSVAHCQESLDAFINDSNWRKIVRIGRNILYMHAILQLTLRSVDSLCGKWI